MMVGPGAHAGTTGCPGVSEQNSGPVRAVSAGGNRNRKQTEESRRWAEESHCREF